MRSLLLFTAILFFSIPGLAQKGKKANPNLPEFGNVDKADLQIKECSFDDKAEALVLLDEGNLDYVNGLELKRRIRVKILSDKGLDWANVHLTYRSEKNDEDITGLEAQTYNLDESGNVIITKLEKKLIYEKKINKKFSEKVFTFPNVKVGSIIEYKFKHRGIGLIDWYFQRSIPVKYSSFLMDYPDDIEISVIPHCSRNYESDRKEQGTRVIKTFTMSNIPGFRDEPYIINEDYYRERLETKLVAYKRNGVMERRTVNCRTERSGSSS